MNVVCALVRMTVVPAVAVVIVIAGDGFVSGCGRCVACGATG